MMKAFLPERQSRGLTGLSRHGDNFDEIAADSQVYSGIFRYRYIDTSEKRMGIIHGATIGGTVPE
jgi:hypothetical protein